MSRRSRSRLAAAALVAALSVAGFTGCEVVPPTSPDRSAPALLNVVGKPADQAVKLLSGAGFEVVVVGRGGTSIPASPDRLVTKQSPDPGAQAAAGRTVTLTVGG